MKLFAKLAFILTCLLTFGIANAGPRVIIWVGSQPYYEQYNQPFYHGGPYQQQLIYVPPTWNGNYWVAGHYEPAGFVYPYSYHGGIRDYYGGYNRGGGQWQHRNWHH